MISSIDYQLNRLEQYREEFEIFAEMCRSDLKEISMLYENTIDDKSSLEKIKERLIRLVEIIIKKLNAAKEYFVKMVKRISIMPAYNYYIANKAKFNSILANKIKLSKNIQLLKTTRFVSILNSISKYKFNINDFNPNDYNSLEDAYSGICNDIFGVENIINKSKLSEYIHTECLITGVIIGEKYEYFGSDIKGNMVLFKDIIELEEVLNNESTRKLQVLKGIINKYPNQLVINTIIHIIDDFTSIAQKMINNYIDGILYMLGYFKNILKSKQAVNTKETE